MCRAASESNKTLKILPESKDLMSINREGENNTQHTQGTEA